MKILFTKKNQAYTNCNNKTFMVFHQIEEAVLNGIVDAGVIIHENRFTYAEKGLYKIMDLGEYWEQQLQVPMAGRKTVAEP